MASVTRSQPTSLSQRVTTAPMNDMSVETVTDTQTGGMAGDDAFGSISLGRPSEDH